MKKEVLSCGADTAIMNGNIQGVQSRQDALTVTDMSILKRVGHKSDIRSILDKAKYGKLKAQAMKI